MKVKDLLLTIEAIEFEKTYQVMDLRLSFGYSAYETSFLLGRRDFYVRDIENPLHTLQYSVNENNYLRQVFNCNLKKIMPGKVVPVTYSIKTETTVNENGLTIYQIYRVTSTGTTKLYRKVTEEPKHVELPLKSTLTANQIADHITKLFRGKYFEEPKTALTIFNDCQKKFNDAIRPSYLADALRFYTAKRKAPRLITKRNESGRMVYLKE